MCGAVVVRTDGSKQRGEHCKSAKLPFNFLVLLIIPKTGVSVAFGPVSLSGADMYRLQCFLPLEPKFADRLTYLQTKASRTYRSHVLIECKI